jgi:hypothetical protein
MQAMEGRHGLMRHALTAGVALGVLWCATAWHRADADAVLWEVVAAGGTIRSASTGYTVSATIGQAAVGMLGGVTYRLYTGFWNPLLTGAVGAEDRPFLGIPHAFELAGNHPNPFGSQTTIRFAVPRHGHVTIEVYDLAGRRVRLLAEGAQEPGYHHVRWDGLDDAGRRAGSGVYLSRMIARNAGGTLYQQSRPMLVVR